MLTGHAAAENAGPAVTLSFVVGGIACAFAGLCYAEMASTVPIAGSAYTYAYATMGEFIAWLIGWDLILEYMVGATTVAIGWSGYVTSVLRDFGINIPAQFTSSPGTKLIEVPNADRRPVAHATRLDGAQRRHHQALHDEPGRLRHLHPGHGDHQRPRHVHRRAGHGALGGRHQGVGAASTT